MPWFAARRGLHVAIQWPKQAASERLGMFDTLGARDSMQPDGPQQRWRLARQSRHLLTVQAVCVHQVQRGDVHVERLLPGHWIARRAWSVHGMPTFPSPAGGAQAEEERMPDLQSRRGATPSVLGRHAQANAISCSHRRMTHHERRPVGKGSRQLPRRPVLLHGGDQSRVRQRQQAGRQLQQQRQLIQTGIKVALKRGGSHLQLGSSGQQDARVGRQVAAQRPPTPAGCRVQPVHLQPIVAGSEQRA